MTGPGCFPSFRLYLHCLHKPDPSFAFPKCRIARERPRAQCARASDHQAKDSVSWLVEKLAVTLAGIDCSTIGRTMPSPAPVVLTPRLKVLPETPATESGPAQEPPVVGSVPPNLLVTTA